MNKRNILIIVLLIVVIAAIALYASGSLNNNTLNVNAPTVYSNSIKDVGTFNTTSVTNFTLDNSTNDVQKDYVANDKITRVSLTSDSNLINATIDGATRINETTNAHTIYKDTVTDGQHKGETRYISILTDNNKFVIVSSADYNLTSMMADTFKFA